MEAASCSDDEEEDDMHFPIATAAGGVVQPPGPMNVCKTPAPSGPTPMPYPSIGQVRNAKDTIDKVLIAKKPVVVIASAVSSTMGDEAGTLKGVVSNTGGSEVAFRKASSKVYAGGKPVVVHMAMTAHNGKGAANLPAGGMHAAPSQQKVVAFP